MQLFSNFSYWSMCWNGLIYCGKRCYYEKSTLFAKMARKCREGNVKQGDNWIHIILKLITQTRFSGYFQFWIFCLFSHARNYRPVHGLVSWFYLQYARHYSPRFFTYLLKVKNIFSRSFFFRKFCLYVWLVFKRGL